MRIVSWNVNGIRAAARKGFGRKLRRSGADVFCVQEVRARPEQLPAGLTRPRGFAADFVAAERPGYSGVGLFSRLPVEHVEHRLGVPEFDREGRVQLAYFGARKRLLIANVYFPNGNGQNRDNGRVPYKLKFYDAVLERLLAERKAGRRVLVMGDFNTAHHAIDLARPRQNLKTSGFLASERAALQAWMDAGFVDTFRALHPGQAGHYTWWSQRMGVRAKNIGWRIDYVLASAAAMRFVQRAFIWPRYVGSDHCPAGVDVDDTIVL